MQKIQKYVLFLHFFRIRFSEIIPEEPKLRSEIIINQLKLVATLHGRYQDLIHVKQNDAKAVDNKDGMYFKQNEFEMEIGKSMKNLATTRQNSTLEELTKNKNLLEDALT